MEKLAKWQSHQFSSGPYAGDDYLEFQRQARSDLRAKAKAAGFEIDTFNKNHYCWSARLKHVATGNLVYVSMGDVRWDNWWTVLYRRMDDPDDWSSRNWPNCRCSWDALPDCLEHMAEKF